MCFSCNIIFILSISKFFSFNFSFILASWTSSSVSLVANLSAVIFLSLSSSESLVTFWLASSSFILVNSTSKADTLPVRFFFIAASSVCLVANWSIKLFSLTTNWAARLLSLSANWSVRLLSLSANWAFRLLSLSASSVCLAANWVIRLLSLSAYCLAVSCKIVFFLTSSSNIVLSFAFLVSISDDNSLFISLHLEICSFKSINSACLFSSAIVFSELLVSSWAARYFFWFFWISNKRLNSSWLNALNSCSLSLCSLNFWYISLILLGILISL